MNCPRSDYTSELQEIVETARRLIVRNTHHQRCVFNTWSVALDRFAQVVIVENGRVLISSTTTGFNDYVLGIDHQNRINILQELRKATILDDLSSV